MRRTRLGAVVSAAVVMATCVVALAPPVVAAPSPGDCVVSAADQVVDSVEYELFTLVNNHRIANGRQPLDLHPDLTRSAAWFSRNMASTNTFPFDHVDTNGRNIPSRFTWCGVRYNAWRENIAANTSGLAIDIFNQWVNSSSHNTNMLATDVTSTGIARAFNAASTFDWYFTQTFSDSAPIPVADFDNSGTSDQSVYRPSTGQWFVRGANPQVTLWGAAGDIAVPGDYNGDGNADKAVYRPSTGQWFLNNASPLPQAIVFGAPCSSNCTFGGDQPVPADYDGDGDTDIAVYRPSTGQWFLRDAHSIASPIQYGNGCGACASPTEIPVPADYTNDGKADVAIYRTSTGQWFVRGGEQGVVYGAAGDRPVPGDYDGDRDADMAVFRPSTGQWFRRGISPQTVDFGIGGSCCGDVPQPGDYNGNGTTDVAVYRKATGQWFVLGGNPSLVTYGVANDIPLVLPYVLRVWMALPA